MDIKRTGQIRDAVLGYVEPSETEFQLISDPHMQRLSRVKQLGLAYLVYPGANHTRFEHSIGTMKIAGEIAQHTGCSDREELEVVGLLHDVGHAPLSHLSDSLLAKYLHTNHEKLGEHILRRSSIHDALTASSLSVKKVLSYFNGKGNGTIITGTLGADRLDYLARDSYYTGTAYGMIDYRSIMNRIKLHRERPAILESGMFNAEDMLMRRYAMFMSVYYHHTEIILEGMYRMAAEAAFESGEADPEVLLRYDDWQMLLKLGECRSSSGLVNRILERRLFKRAADRRIQSNIDIGEVRQAVEGTGLKSNEYVATLSRVKGWNDDIDVVDRDGRRVGSLREMSPLIKALEGLMESRRQLIVACDKRNVPKVSRALDRLLG